MRLNKEASALSVWAMINKHSTRAIYLNHLAIIITKSLLRQHMPRQQT